MSNPEQSSVSSSENLTHNIGEPAESDVTRFTNGPGKSSISNSQASRFAFVERAKQEWEKTVDALPELICVVNDQGCLVRANLTVERWSLGSVISVAGQKFHHFIHHNCEPGCYLTDFLDQALEKTLADEPFELEIYDAILRRHILIRALPIHSGDETAGRHLAIILHDITSRKEMESALQQNNNRLKILNTVSNAILSAQSPEEIAWIVLQHVKMLVPFQQAHIMLAEPDAQRFSVLASAADNSALFLDRTVPYASFGENIGRCTSELFLIGDLHHPDGLTQFEKQMRDHGSGSYVNVPLRAREQPLGMFIVGMDSIDTFNASQIQVIREVSEMLAVAIRQAQLHQEYRRTNDELQYLLRLRDRLADHCVAERCPPLSLVRDHTDTMSDEFFGLLQDDTHDATLKRDNLDDLVR